jgi:hypothetical protein
MIANYKRSAPDNYDIFISLLNHVPPDDRALALHGWVVHTIEAQKYLDCLPGLNCSIALAISQPDCRYRLIDYLNNYYGDDSDGHEYEYSR